MLDYNSNLAILYGEAEWYMKQTDLAPLINGWLVPNKVKISGKNILYKYEGTPIHIEPERKVLKHELLGGFLELADAEDEDILKFAKKWGGLGLCHHGYPMAHTIRDVPWVAPLDTDEATTISNPFAIAFEKGCELQKKDGWFCEPLDKWRDYSRQFRAIASLAVALRKAKPVSNGQVEQLIRVIPEKLSKVSSLPKNFVVEISPKLPGRPEDWKTAFKYFEHYGMGSINIVGGAQHALSHVINRWISITGVRPFLFWGKNDSNFVLASRDFGNGLLPVLTVQLMLAVVGSPDYTVCASCDRPFFLRKGQSYSETRKAYCPTCGKQAALRDAVKRYTRRKRENTAPKVRKRLKEEEVVLIQHALSEGTPVLEIAKQFGVTEWAIYKIRQGINWKNK